MHDLASLSAKLARLGRDEGAKVDETPQAAVAAIFRETEGRGLELFFIVRAERDGDPWSGHVAFPGGRREPDDASLLATAVRETREEVGIDLDGATLLARLPDSPAFTRSKRSTLVVAPFVFAIEEDVVARPNHEVAKTLWIPFASLARGEGKGTFLWKWENQSMELPCIRIGPDRHMLWGMTYRMLETMLEALLPAPPAPDTIAGG